ncbi:putative transposase (plasmid) [Ochrobactrum quorumnocens]|uniref:Putative transposase n=1 Tax=Ochrobactrum quorumnocens TaxID=271865 RepID=A0A248UQ05_9HYPH|nr:putative transposase [[Ochrobactrum] quorumnocens]
MRKTHPQPLAFAASPMTTGHIGCRPGLINEHEPLWIETELLLELSLPLFQNVRTALLYRMPSLFCAFVRAGQESDAMPTC